MRLSSFSDVTAAQAAQTRALQVGAGLFHGGVATGGLLLKKKSPKLGWAMLIWGVTGVLWNAYQYATADEVQL